ncbi:MAG: glycosyltransferase family 4 protein [Bacteroidetes bacterium]|nr:glycosyltransferase family 4 protein [Bacteroidota bacterium]
MIVGVDLERLRNVNSGLGQFCLHLAAGLLTQKRNDIHLHYYYPRNQTFNFDTEYSQIVFFDKIFGVKNRSLDLFHCTHQDSRLFPGSTPTVMTIHDLNFLEKYDSESKRRSRLAALQKKVSRAHGLAFISKYTRDLAASHLKFPDVPLRVIYNGNCLSATGAGSKPAGLPFDHFLFSIGIINPKKNMHTLIGIVKQSGIPLVLSGNNSHPYAAEIMDHAKAQGVSDKVYFTGPVTEPEKLWLYKNCRAFLFPSLAEGFGLPVVEAMSLGKPVFLSDKGSLPEIGGQLAYYWNHFDEAHMHDVFQKGMNDFESQPEKRTALIQWASQFSWERAAADYLDFYSEVYTRLP